MMQIAIVGACCLAIGLVLGAVWMSKHLGAAGRVAAAANQVEDAAKKV